MSRLGLSNFLLFLALVCFSLTLFLDYQRNNPGRLAFESSQALYNSNEKTINVDPQAILIDDLEINLPIVPAKIVKNKWETTNIGVSYLSISPKPGEVGNSILYGHNWTNLLGKLTRVRPGQKVRIVYPRNQIKEFVVEYTATVSPKDVSILAQTNDKRITIYTCAGFLDSKRFVVVAKEV